MNIYRSPGTWPEKKFGEVWILRDFSIEFGHILKAFLGHYNMNIFIWGSLHQEIPLNTPALTRYFKTPTGLKFKLYNSLSTSKNSLDIKLTPLKFR